jgi:Beta-propeller repeat
VQLHAQRGINGPIGLATDSAGNLFIADYLNQRIRKVSTNGIISTVAGNGIAGYSGDDIQATNSRLNYPTSVAVDSIGNLYIADAFNRRVRMVNTNGVIWTIAGNGIGGFSGDGLQATNASMYPYGVAVDSVGNVFIADTYNYRIRKVNIQGSSYSIKNVSSTNTGSYNLIVTGSFGSITSSIVKLAVITTLPSITIPTMLASGQFQFSFGTATNVNYTVQCSTNLAQWFSLTNLGGIGTPITLIDSNTASSQQRFYRIRLSAQ